MSVYPGKFAIYSDDATDVSDPTTASQYVFFDRDPAFARWDPVGSRADRGSVHETLSGVIIQDYGVKVVDQVITFGDTDALKDTTVDILNSFYVQINTEWLFTDGYNVWKVQFSRNPKGFRYWRNLVWASRGVHLFSYEIRLLVKEKLI